MTALTDVETASCVAMLADTLDRISELQRVADDLKATLRTLGPTRGREFGEVRLSISPNLRFDGKRARTILAPDLYLQILVAKPDPTAARSLLPPETFRACCSEGEMIVRLT